MSKEVSVNTSSGRKLYKVSQSGSYFYCYKYSGSIFGSWSEIGRTRSFEDALSLIRAYASARYGKIYDVRIS
jgi:hypothetical protein